MVLGHPTVLNFTEGTVREHFAWWTQSGLDHMKVPTSQPTLLGSPRTTELQARLDFLRCVAGMSTEELNNAPSLFLLSLDGRLRARYFYALLKHRLGRFGTINTMMQANDAAFVAMMQGGSQLDHASELEVAQIGRAHV